jgi:aryl-alcohol dehydrogenase-like predicted oxidoreductase
MDHKKLILGSAQWGWTVAADAAFRILDAWLKTGNRAVDGATNYPINRNPADFRRSEKILLEYIAAHGLRDLKLTLKIGSMNNLRAPDVNLSPSFIAMMAEEYLRLFDGNLEGIMLHWDNRADAAAIRASLDSLSSLYGRYRLQPGLSGIAHPDVYAELLPEYDFKFDIQLKNNILQSDLPRFQPLLGQGHRFFAYGINAGGIKLEGGYDAHSAFLARGGKPDAAAAVLATLQKRLPGFSKTPGRPPVTNMNHIGLIYNLLNPNLNGVLIGVSSLKQLEETLDFYKNIENFDYKDVYAALSIN